MNKKFSTLVAALLVAGGMSSSAFATDKTIDVTKFFTLDNNGKSLIVGEDATRDSLALLDPNTVKSLYDLNKTLWKVSVEPVKNADGLVKAYRVYLENKINGAVALTKVDASEKNSLYYAPGAVVASGKFLIDEVVPSKYDIKAKTVTISKDAISFGTEKIYNGATKTVDGYKLVLKDNSVIKLVKGTADASKAATTADIEKLIPTYPSDAKDADLSFTITEYTKDQTMSIVWMNAIGNESFHLVFNKDITDNAKFANPFSASDLTAVDATPMSAAQYATATYAASLKEAKKIAESIDQAKKDVAAYVKEVKVALNSEAKEAGSIDGDAGKAPNYTDINTTKASVNAIALFPESFNKISALVTKSYSYENVAAEGKDPIYKVKDAATKIVEIEKAVEAINKDLDAYKAATVATIAKYDEAVQDFVKVAYRYSANEEIDFSGYKLKIGDKEFTADKALTEVKKYFATATVNKLMALETLPTVTPSSKITVKIQDVEDESFFPYAVVGKTDTYVTVDTSYVASREKYLALNTTKLNTLVVAAKQIEAGKYNSNKEAIPAGAVVTLKNASDFTAKENKGFFKKVLVPELGKDITRALFKMETVVKNVSGDVIKLYANSPKVKDLKANGTDGKNYCDYLDNASYYDMGQRIVIRTLGGAREASVKQIEEKDDVLNNTTISFLEPTLASKIKDGAIYFVKEMNEANESEYGKYQVVDPVNVVLAAAKNAYKNVPATQWLVSKNNDNYTLNNRDFKVSFKSNQKIYVVDEDKMIYTTSDRDTFQLVEVDAEKAGHLGYKFISEEIQKISDYVLSAINYANVETPYYLSFNGSKDSTLIATADKEKALQLIPMIKDEKQVTEEYKMNDENLSKQYYQLISKAGKDTLYLIVKEGELKVTKVPQATLLQFRNINDTTNEYEVLIGEKDLNGIYDASHKLSYNQVGQAVAVGLNEATAFVYDLVDNSTDIYKNFGFTGTTNVIISLNGDEASKVTKVGPFAAVKRTGLDLRAAAKDEDFALVMDTAFVDQKDNIRYAYYITKPIEAGKTAWNDEKCYMVTYKDSVAADRSNDTIKYSQDGLTRIGFVHAKRINADSLAISKIAPAAADTLNVTEKAGVTNATFAFAIDENDENAYRIESSKGEYVSYLNGVLVLGAKEQAQLFNVTETELIPTDNEAIEAEGVKIIAGNGSVTIQGAAGETAYVRTVLGRTVAETVLTSDNATIAAPAGVVFVTVGNETAKVVVK